MLEDKAENLHTSNRNEIKLKTDSPKTEKDSGLCYVYAPPSKNELRWLYNLEEKESYRLIAGRDYSVDFNELFDHNPELNSLSYNAENDVPAHRNADAVGAVFREGQPQLEKNNLQSKNGTQLELPDAATAESNKWLTLGLYFQFGPKQNLAKAVKYYLLAAKLGNASAMNNLGVCFTFGLGVELDRDLAYRFFCTAGDSDLGNLSEAIINCALDHLDHPPSWHFEKVMQLAIFYLERAGDHPEALFQLAKYNGEGFKFNINDKIVNGKHIREYSYHKDEEQALRDYLLAAERGHVKSQIALGKRYRSETVEKDLKKAQHYFESALAQEKDQLWTGHISETFEYARKELTSVKKEIHELKTKLNKHSLVPGDAPDSLPKIKNQGSVSTSSKEDKKAPDDGEIKEHQQDPDSQEFPVPPKPTDQKNNKPFTTPTPEISEYALLLQATIKWGLSGAEQEMLRRSVAETKQKENNPAQKLTNYAAQWGYACHDMAKDDNCFYHAVSHQLQQQLGINIPYDKLRAIAVEHVLENLALYSGSVDQSMHTFIDKMSQNREWADEIHLRALSRALNLSLVIVRSDEKVNVLRRENPNAVLHLGYEVGVHYQSLTIKNRALYKKLKKEVAKAEKDTVFRGGLSLKELRELNQPKSVSAEHETKRTPAIGASSAGTMGSSTSTMTTLPAGSTVSSSRSSEDIKLKSQRIELDPKIGPLANEVAQGFSNSDLEESKKIIIEQPKLKNETNMENKKIASGYSPGHFKKQPPKKNITSKPFIPSPAPEETPTLNIILFGTSPS